MGKLITFVNNRLNIHVVLELSIILQVVILYIFQVLHISAAITLKEYYTFATVN